MLAISGRRRVAESMHAQASRLPLVHVEAQALEQAEQRALLLFLGRCPLEERPDRQRHQGHDRREGEGPPNLFPAAVARDALPDEHGFLGVEGVLRILQGASRDGEVGVLVPQQPGITSPRVLVGVRAHPLPENQRVAAHRMDPLVQRLPGANQRVVGRLDGVLLRDDQPRLDQPFDDDFRA